MAEQYCAERKDNLLTDLFKIYIKLYNDVKKTLVDNPDDQKRLEFKDFILN